MEPVTEQALGRAFKTTAGEPRGDLQGGDHVAAEGEGVTA